MKALSVKQPWAELIASGLKTIETRTYQTSYRGQLLICSSKKPHFEGAIQCPNCFSFEDNFDVMGAPPGKLYCNLCEKWVVPRTVLGSPSGMALCTVNIVDCRPMTEADEKDACCGIYQGAFSWVLSDVKRIEYFPVKGQLGLFNLPIDNRE